MMKIDAQELCTNMIIGGGGGGGGGGWLPPGSYSTVLVGAQI